MEKCTFLLQFNNVPKNLNVKGFLPDYNIENWCGPLRKIHGSPGT